MVKINEIVQQPGQKELMLRQAIMESLHVALPGEIQEYNPETRTATIQPVIRKWRSADTPPLLLDVPVFFWGNFIFTPEKGDGCLVIFADSCIDSWLQSGGVSSPMSARRHSLSDGFAFVGFRQKNGDDLRTILAGKKNLQMVVEDPLPDGTDTAFISNISQDNDGVIMVKKKKIELTRQMIIDALGYTPARENS